MWLVLLLQEFNANLPIQGIQSENKKMIHAVVDLLRSCSRGDIGPTERSDVRLTVLQFILRLMSAKQSFDELGRTPEDVRELMVTLQSPNEMYVRDLCMCMSVCVCGAHVAESPQNVV